MLADKKKIMIIEDEQDIVDIMEFVLSEAGYEVISGSDETLLTALEHHQPDLILLDNQLAWGFGYEICKQLKSDPKTAHIAVVLVTANLRVEQMAQECGADAYPSKPFDLDDFIALVNRLLMN